MLLRSDSHSLHSTRCVRPYSALATPADSELRPPLPSMLLSAARSNYSRWLRVAHSRCVTVRVIRTAPAPAVRSFSGLSSTLPPPRSSSFCTSSHSRSFIAAAILTLTALFLNSYSSPILAADAAESSDASKPAYRRLPQSVTVAERHAVAALRSSLQLHLPSLDPKLASYAQQWALDDDWCLLRYIRAHKLHVANAQAGIIHTAAWRMAEQVDQIRLVDFTEKWGASSPGGCSMYVSEETDPLGRSIVVYKKSASPSVGWNPEVYKLEVHALVYTMERAIREMEDRVARGELTPAQIDYEFDCKMIWYIDTGLYNSSSATPWHVTKSLVDVMRLHYPERLHRAVIVDAPWILRSLTRLLHPFIDRVTRDKVFFLSDRRSASTLVKLREIFGDPLSKLPADSGVPGAQSEFSYERYKARDPLGKTREESLRFNPRDFDRIKNQAGATTEGEAGGIATHLAALVDSKKISEALDKLAFWK